MHRDSSAAGDLRAAALGRSHNSLGLFSWRFRCQGALGVALGGDIDSEMGGFRGFVPVSGEEVAWLVAGGSFARGGVDTRCASCSSQNRIHTARVIVLTPAGNAEPFRTGGPLTNRQPLSKSWPRCTPTIRPVGGYRRCRRRSPSYDFPHRAPGTALRFA